MPPVALLGAGGFLGSHVYRALAAADQEVLALRRGLPLREQLEAAGPAVVVNCAGATHGSRSELEAANVHLVLGLVDEMRGVGARLIQIGSSAEYGPGVSGTPISEEHPAHPVGEYGATKLAATQAVLAAQRAGRLAATVLRVFNPVGAGMASASLPGHAATLVRRALDQGGPVELGSLNATRDFVDARDVADAVVAACFAPAADGQVLNVGSGRGATARELVQTLAEIAGYAGPIGEGASGSPRSATVSWQVADIRRAATVLGWAPRRSLAEALAALWSGIA
ncbi:MAG: NAD(P)-dependent oxidoreductase [Chloroflexota bacterium]|nr:NAD(P)-dependent oxidoreductase [Chloroflexota bacterium]